MSGRVRKSQLFGASIVHEIQNHLSISQYVGLFLHQQLTSLTKPMKDGSYCLTKAGFGELQKLAGQLKSSNEQTLAKIKRFGMALRQEHLCFDDQPVGVAGLIQMALKDEYFQQEKLRSKLKLAVQDDFLVKVPKTFFSHLIYNLVKNSYHHGEATEISITLDAAKRSLCIWDNGKGIPNHRLPYIFDLFYTPDSNGSGIGLTLVKEIVTACYATIYSESEQGKGSYTKFTICFPKR